jgi:branched-subunit amino acid ABC-type transport system permease component
MDFELYRLAIITGIAVGGIYALVAVGITQIFAVTRVLNFAQAGFAVWGAYIYSWLTIDQGWPVGWAALLSVGAVALLGLVSDLIVSRWAARASSVNKIILTLGLLQVLTALAIWRFGSFGRTSVKLFPAGSVDVFGAAVTWSQLGNLAAVVVIVVLLEGFLRYTRLGLLTRATAEDSTIAELQGTSTGFIGLVNWTIAAGIGGLAGVLAASLQPFESSTFLTTFLLALVASLIGGLHSLVMTALGGIGLGVLLQVTAVASSTAGMGQLIVFLGVVVYVLARRRWPSDFAKIAWSRPRPSRGFKYWWVSVIVFAGLWTWLIVAVIRSDFWGQTGALIFVYAVTSMSFVPLLGWTSQISLAQGGLMAVGAYSFGKVFNSLGWPLVPALAAGMVAGAAAGALIGLICYRLSFVQSAIVTLAFTSMVTSWLLFTNFFDTPVGRLDLPALSFLNTGRRLFWGFGIVALLTAYLLSNVRRSQWGIRFFAVRTAPTMARHFGVGVARTRITAFALSGGVAALGGIMFAVLLQTTEAATFGIALSLQVLLYAVIGGTTAIGGAFLGPLVLVGFPQAINLARYGTTTLPNILAGVGTIQIMATNPDGMLTLVTPPDSHRTKLRQLGSRVPFVGRSLVREFEGHEDGSGPYSQGGPTGLVSATPDVDQAVEEVGGRTP